MARNIFLALLAVGVIMVVALPCKGQAQEPPAPAPATEPAKEPAPADVVPILQGKAAPFTGLLVPELRFTELLEAELTTGELRVKLKVAEREAEALEAMYREKIDEATQPLAWYETPSFNRWLGFGIGVVVTALAVWGAVELTGAVTTNGGTTR